MRSMLLLVLPQMLAGAVVGQTAHAAPDNAPSRITIADAAEPGAGLAVSGRVLGNDNRPVANASVYVYQTDARGEYVRGSNGGSDRPRLFGYFRTDDQGRYSFATIKPGSYPNSSNPAHIHFEVSAAEHESRVYEIVFEGDPYISDRFRAQARQPLGGVAIVSERRTPSGAIEVAHDIRIRVR